MGGIIPEYIDHRVEVNEGIIGGNGIHLARVKAALDIRHQSI